MTELEITCGVCKRKSLPLKAIEEGWAVEVYVAVDDKLLGPVCPNCMEKTPGLRVAP